MRKLKEKYTMNFENVKLESESLIGLFQEFGEMFDESISEIESEYVKDSLNWDLNYNFGYGYAENLIENQPDKYNDYYFNTLLSLDENVYLDFFKEYFERKNLKLEITKVMSF